VNLESRDSFVSCRAYKELLARNRRQSEIADENRRATEHVSLLSPRFPSTTGIPTLMHSGQQSEPESLTLQCRERLQKEHPIVGALQNPGTYVGCGHQGNRKLIVPLSSTVNGAPDPSVGYDPKRKSHIQVVNR
jgi:hypothetical protein